MISGRFDPNADEAALPRIVLTGFMGTGKTETGRALSGILGLEFIDTDCVIEEREGLTIAEIFAKQGEAYFRRSEEEVCEILATRSGVVIATGGGTLVNGKNFEILSDGARLVLLEADVETILERTGGNNGRPLLGIDSGSEGGVPAVRRRVVSLLDERKPVYHRITDRIDTSNLSPLDAACRIAATLNLPSRRIEIPPSSRWEGGTEPAGRIEIGRGLISALGDRLRTMGLGTKVFVLIPESLDPLFFPQIAASLERASIPWSAIQVRDGDAEKNLDQASELLDELASRGAARDSTIVTVGGGVCGDLGGFVASIYMRGIPLVHVPTTLLAQVDSSIGGKVGVNHPRAKNLIGNLYPPNLVLSDPCALRTLPEAEISNGMAEVVKTAVLGNADLFRFIECELSDDPGDALRRVSFLERCVTDCAAVKSAIVERDPFERDERRVLNLGHTLGHALETVGGYHGFTHGQAVSVGLAAAMRIAKARGLVAPALVERTRTVLEHCGLPVTPPRFERDALVAGLHLDKKKRSGRLHFVLPTGLGSVVIVDDVTEAEMLEALREEEE